MQVAFWMREGMTDDQQQRIVNQVKRRWAIGEALPASASSS